MEILHEERNPSDLAQDQILREELRGHDLCNGSGRGIYGTCSGLCKILTGILSASWVSGNILIIIFLCTSHGNCTGQAVSSLGTHASTSALSNPLCSSDFLLSYFPLNFVYLSPKVQLKGFRAVSGLLQSTRSKITREAGSVSKYLYS